MRTTSLKRAIRLAFFRLGLHTRPKGVINALSEQGIQVNEELVRQVRFELLKETSDERPTRVSRPALSRPVRRQQQFPGRVGNRGSSR